MNKSNLLIISISLLALLMALIIRLPQNQLVVNNDEVVNEEQTQNDEHEEDEQDFHFHTGVRVAIDGVWQDYNAFKYMHIKPCNDEELAALDEKTEYDRIHFHDFVGDVAHIHAGEVTWRELFVSLGVSELLERTDIRLISETLGEFKNLNVQASEYDSVKIIFGEEPTEGEFVTKEYIVEAESSLESCGKK